MKVNVGAPQKKHRKNEKNAKLFSALRMHRMAVLVLREGKLERGLSRLNHISTCLMPPSSGDFLGFFTTQ